MKIFIFIVIVYFALIFLGIGLLTVFGIINIISRNKASDYIYQFFIEFLDLLLQPKIVSTILKQFRKNSQDGSDQRNTKT